MMISSIVFIFAYGLHRKFSFKDYKKVGVAIYANGIENIEKIYTKVGLFSDFIHVDIIDKSINNKAKEVKTYKLETIKAYWPNTQIQTHIMSMNPEKWIDEVMPYSDVIYIHEESKKDIIKFFDKIKKNGKKAGLALMMTTKINDVINLLENADYVLLLTIPKPGESGQNFSEGALEKINIINSLKFRNKFILCIDGGVDESIINLLHAENIVSGSSVLNNVNPKQQIMRLQTSGRYQ
jgi:ribulose-phosphate 3-epimerase